ncbi:alginate lyase 2 [Boeremia exigua]|uniref:alginate lyase 2 n=1 Tax=Boeremia exigua TaxID=749465 RepID=UPI001E8EDA7B|nr:alginate lyase 2 [Boeremia exigua]KAH6644066.1 alginate lyase 2 [Boeremia exigua]
MAPIKDSIVAIVLLFVATAVAAPFPGASTNANDPSCAPGGNFDLKSFNLQLPTGSAGKVDQITGSKLSGCDGWSSSKYFYTSPSGALVMKVPSRSECVTTPNSKHCRTELREASPRSWDPKKNVNLLKAKLSVPKPDNSKYGTVVGQVKVDDSISKKPVAELFYNRSGTLTIGVSQIPDVSSLKMTEVGRVDVGKTFQYELRYEGGKLSLQIDGGEKKIMSIGKLSSPKSYFKVGNYNQGSEPSEVVFYDIKVTHG